MCYCNKSNQWIWQVKFFSSLHLLLKCLHPKYQWQRERKRCCERTKCVGLETFASIQMTRGTLLLNSWGEIQKIFKVPWYLKLKKVSISRKMKRKKQFFSHPRFCLEKKNWPILMLVYMSNESLCCREGLTRK